MKTIKSLFFIALFSIMAGSASGVEGLNQFKFGMTFDEAKQVHQCVWKELDITFKRWLIIQSENTDLYKCEGFNFQDKTSELYLEFVNLTLQRIIVDISGEEADNQKALAAFKKQYGYKKENVVKKDRSRLYSFDDATVEVEIWDPPLNLMYLRFYSMNYRDMIKQPFFKKLDA